MDQDFQIPELDVQETETSTCEKETEWEEEHNESIKNTGKLLIKRMVTQREYSVKFKVEDGYRGICKRSDDCFTNVNITRG